MFHRLAIRPGGGNGVFPASLWSYLLVLPFYAALRRCYFDAGPVQRVPDTVTYETVDFLARGSTRLFTVPLLYHLVPSDGRRAASQLVISILCWVSLAAVMAWVTRGPWMEPVAFAVVLLFSVSMSIVTWDRFLIAESVSFSLLVLLVAAWMAFVRRPGAWTLAVAAPVTLLFAFLRETHSVLVAGLAGALLLWLLAPGARRYKAWAAALAAGIAAWSLAVVMQPHERTRFNLDNVIAQRILTDPERLAYFEKAGMPATPKLLSLAGKWASSDGYASFNAPELEAFRGWFDREFAGAYVRYLASHPGWTLGGPLADSQLLFPDPRQSPYSFYFEKQAISFPGGRFLFPESKGLLVALLLTALGFATLARVRGGLTREAAIPIALLLSVIPHALLVWHGDAMEVARHALQVAVSLRLGLVLLLLLGVDGVLAAASGREAAQPDRQHA